MKEQHRRSENNNISRPLFAFLKAGTTDYNISVTTCCVTTVSSGFLVLNNYKLFKESKSMFVVNMSEHVC